MLYLYILVLSGLKSNLKYVRFLIAFLEKLRPRIFVIHHQRAHSSRAVSNLLYCPASSLGPSVGELAISIGTICDFIRNLWIVSYEE
jgi:hypothetical protein